MELTDDEWIVLAALVRRLIHADQEITPAEQHALTALQQRAGTERWNAAVRAARASGQTRSGRTPVIRPEARPILHRALADLVGTDGPEVSELAAIVREWGLGD